MKVKLLMTAVVLTLLLPISASGQEKKNYIMLKSGLYTFKSDLREADFATGFNGEVAYGRYLHPNFVLEGGTGYFHDGVNKVYGNDVQGTPIILTAKGVYPFKGWELFAGGGIGIYPTKFHGSVHGNLADARDTLFGGHLLTGANLDVSRSLFLGIEGKYIFTSTGDFKVFEATLNGYTVNLSLGLRF